MRKIKLLKRILQYFFNKWLSVAYKLKIIQYAEERGTLAILINIEFQDQQ